MEGECQAPNPAHDHSPTGAGTLGTGARDPPRTLPALMDSLASERLPADRKAQPRDLRTSARPEVVLGIWEPFLRMRDRI